jgi:hypothetical protein
MFEMGNAKWEKTVGHVRNYIQPRSDYMVIKLEKYQS